MSDAYDPVRHIGPAINQQKMYDFERDILRVKNPLNAAFTFEYDGLPRTIEANGTKDWERYLVRRYIWNMIGHIYNQYAEKKMTDMEESFKRTHPDVIDDPYLLNEQIYLKMKRADDPAFQQKVIDDCIVGLVSKFGQNRVLDKRPVNNGKLDPNSPLYMDLIDGIKTIDPNLQNVQPLAPIQPQVATTPVIPDATQPLTTVAPLSAQEVTI